MIIGQRISAIRGCLRLINSRILARVPWKIVLLWALAWNNCQAQTQRATLSQLQVDLSSWNRTTGPEGSVVLLFSPPLPIDPPLASGDGLASSRALSLLVDRIPDRSIFISPSGRTTYSVYSAILNYRAPEVWILNKEQQRELHQSERLLLKRYCVFARLYWWFFDRDPPREDSKRYLQYKGYANRDAQLRTKLGQTASGTNDYKTLMDQISANEQEWRTKGHKEQLQIALKTYRSVQQTNPELFWADAGNEYTANLLGEGATSFPKTIAIPPAQSWTSSENWLAWETGQSKGLIKVIDLKRDWLNIAVITTHRWTWAEGVFAEDQILVSDGSGLSASSHHAVLMPILPVSLVLGRKLATAGNLVVADSPLVIAMICMALPEQPRFREQH